jgi:alkylation response protein AidB-like acyl-CoA dehydrogenase
MADQHAPHFPLTHLSDDERLFRSSVREFAETVIAPHVREMEQQGAIPRPLIDQLFALGLMGIEIPEPWHGAGAHFFQSVIAVEELARVDPSIAVLVDVQNTLVITALRKWGSLELKERCLPRLATDTIGAYALSEATSGSDAFALTTQAKEDGDDYLLTGRKLWVTNAHDAGLFLVWANAHPEAGHRGITAFMIERDCPGLHVGRKEDKLGIRASSTCELVLDECRVPKRHVVGEIGRGYKIAIETLNEGRIGIGAQMVGLAQAALDHTARHLRERRQFGHPLATFQGVQFQFAQAQTEVEMARLGVYNAARLRDRDQPFVTEASMAKLFSSQVAERTTSLAIQLFGGVGYTRDYPVEKLYRDAKIGQIYEGTSNMQLQTIAKQILLQQDAG